MGSTLSRRRVVLGGTALLSLACSVGRGSQVASVQAQGTLPELALRVLQGIRSPELDDFLSAWPRTTVRRPVMPTSVPVLRWLPSAVARAPGFAEPLAAALLKSAGALAWRRSYSAPAVSDDFLDNYGWCELVGLTGEQASDRVACGCLLLGPRTLYPRHRHEAREIYVPLSGTASWGRGEGDWREVPPGEVIHHASDEPHAMQAAAAPLLALYLWRRSNLDQKSRLDP